MKSVKIEETHAELALADFKRDAVKDVREVKHVDPHIQKLVSLNTTARTVADMPSGFRFEDVDQTATVAEPKTANGVLSTLITVEEAATRFH